MRVYDWWLHCSHRQVSASPVVASFMLVSHCDLLNSNVYALFCRVGRNVAAGMTGGLGYFLDEDDTFISKVLYYSLPSPLSLIISTNQSMSRK